MEREEMNLVKNIMKRLTDENENTSEEDTEEAI